MCEGKLPSSAALEAGGRNGGPGPEGDTVKCWKVTLEAIGVTADVYSFDDVEEFMEVVRSVVVHRLGDRALRFFLYLDGPQNQGFRGVFCVIRENLLEKKHNVIDYHLSQEFANLDGISIDGTRRLAGYVAKGKTEPQGLITGRTPCTFIKENDGADGAVLGGLWFSAGSMDGMGVNNRADIDFLREVLGNRADFKGVSEGGSTRSAGARLLTV